jgi:PAS domain S-box-containing protein
MSELESRVDQLKAISELGLQALSRTEFSVLAEQAVKLVTQALQVQIATVDELQADGDLIVRAGCGLGPVVGQGEQPATVEPSLAGYTLRSAHTVISTDLANEQRFVLPESFVQAGAQSCIGITVGPSLDPWGVLIAATTSPREFSCDDAAFLQSVANVLDTVIRLERTEASAKLAERELKRLADAAEQGSDAIMSLDLHNRFRHWNRGAERLFGVSAGDAIGLSMAELNELTSQSEETGARAMAAIHRGLAGERGHVQENQRRHTDGTVRDLSVSVTPWRIEGQVVGVTSIVTDITGRKQAERATARLAAIVEASDDAIIGKTLDGSITSWNPAAERIYGYTPSETVGQNISMLTLPDREAEVEQIMASVARGVAVRHLETKRRCKDGRVIDVSVTVSPIRDGNGEIVGAATVARDTTNQRQAEYERLRMLEATARAEGANRAKSDFLARMSHELRTPLNSIMGFSQLMQMEGLQPRQQKHASLVLKAARHLLQLINEVLDLTSIEAGRLSVSPEPVALADAVNEAIELIAPLALERDVTVHADTTGLAGDGHVMADRNRLKQVLLNLLSNAIKYNRAGGKVEISFTTIATHHVQTRIADTGTGIRADQLPKLFEPFERLGAKPAETEGTGLGLSISKALLEAMGGTIGVQSVPGSGTTFSIELAKAARQDLGPEAQRQDARLRQLNTLEKQRRILYIEDNLSNLTLVEQILGRYPAIKLLSAIQGTLGLDLAREHQPHLIILDMHLPDISGIEVLKRLKSEQATRDIPVVVLTADASKTQADHARRLGASDYLTKPLDIVSFIETISHHLAAPGDEMASG